MSDIVHMNAYSENNQFISGGELVGVAVKDADLANSALQLMFVEEPLSDGWVAVKSVAHGGYWSLSESGDLVTAAAQLDQMSSADAMSRFGFQFQSMSAGWVIKSGNGATLARSSSGSLIFNLQSPPALIQRHQYTQPVAAFARNHNECSCHQDGDEHGREVKWEIDHHQGIVTSAIELLADPKFENIEGRQRVLDMFANPDLKRMVMRGLADADEVWFYSDFDTYVSHFYDPDTQTNYQGGKTPTGLNSYVKYAKRSRSYCDRIEAYQKIGYKTGSLYNFYVNAGYQLGLALHFLTDLSQPMHAANFINFYADGDSLNIRDKRHEGFEKLGQKLFPKHRIRAVDVTAAEIDPNNLNIKTEKDLAYSLARKSKGIYNTKLLDVLRKHAWYVGNINEHLVFNNEFTESECGEILRETAKNAQLATASALLLWAQRDTDPYLWPAGTMIAYGQTSPEAPAMSHFAGKFYVFWLSNEERRRILWSSTVHGLEWSTPWPVAIGDDPADSKLIAIEYANSLYLFWKPINGRGLRIAIAESYGSAEDGDLVFNKKIHLLSDVFIEGMPSACLHNGRLYLSWVEKGGSGKMMLSSKHVLERDWATPYALNQTDSSPQAPALCSNNQYLYAFWRANDGSCRIYWSRSEDGLHWSTGQVINGSDSTPKAPTAFTVNGKVTVFWTANDESRALYSSSSSDGVSWPAGTKINNVDTGSEPPVIVRDGIHYHLAWRDGDGSGHLSCTSKSFAA